MSLTPDELTRLIAAIDTEWDLPRLELFVMDRFTIQLNNLAPVGELKERVHRLITVLSSETPPRDRELLDQLRMYAGNVRLQTLAEELLTPQYYAPPPGDPHAAILLGRTAFVDRDDLRRDLVDFTSPSAYTTRVLFIRGSGPCGKSYSWHFLRHLARSKTRAEPRRLRLNGRSYAPTELFQDIFRLLNLDTSALPSMPDDPQLSRVDPLVNSLKGNLDSLTRPYWLVIDDLNDLSVTPAIREAAYGSHAVEEVRPPNLWVALIGFNAQITDPDLREAKQENARFPDVTSLGRHFELMAEMGPSPLAPEDAQELASALLQQYPELTKEAMIELTPMIEGVGRRLAAGLRPWPS